MIAAHSKICFKCGETKQLSEFYKHPQMSDGHVNKCKVCNKADVKENRQARESYYHAYDRVRSGLPYRKEQKRLRESRPEVKSSIAEYKRAYKYNKFRKAANTAVDNAVKRGCLLKQPCFICGDTKVEGHHPDYSRPLDVVWLCTSHHAEIHRKHDRESDVELLTVTVKGSRYD